MLYLAADNKLYYPNAAMTIGTFRAYFTLNGITAGDMPGEARAFVLNFGDSDEATGITTPLSTRRWGGGEAFYSLDGRRLQGKLVQKGVYVVNGKKIVIK